MHILLIADDQILPASSRAGLQVAATLAGEWAEFTAQQYHIDKPDKTAVLLMGQAAIEDQYNSSPVVLAGRPAPCTLSRKWCGILWDAWLSFIPLLQARISAARSAFKPLCAIARSGAAPLEEVREAMRSKVEGTLFFGVMFIFMAPGYYDALVALQLEFERSLLGLAP